MFSFLIFLIVVSCSLIRAEPPWRPGNFNMPETTATVENKNEKEEKDGDPYLPTINVHYNYKPQDWVTKERTANQIINLRRDLRDAASHYYKNRYRLKKNILRRKTLLQRLLNHLLKAKPHADPLLPDSILTGSIAHEPVEMSRLRNLVIKEWEKKNMKLNNGNGKDVAVENDFRRADYPIYRSPDIYTYISDQFIAQ